MAIETRSVVILDTSVYIFFVVSPSKQVNYALFNQMLQRTLDVYLKQTHRYQRKEFQQIIRTCDTALGLLSLTKDGAICAGITFILTVQIVFMFFLQKTTQRWQRAHNNSVKALIYGFSANTYSNGHAHIPHPPSARPLLVQVLHYCNTISTEYPPERVCLKNNVQSTMFLFGFGLKGKTIFFNVKIQESFYPLLVWFL